jgi:hypothetical protein
VSHAILRGTSPGRDGTVLKRHASGKPMNNLELVDLLCSASAAIREARRAHVACFGALIPHVFMGDVLRRMGACVATGAARRDCAEIEGVLRALERGIATGDRETRDVIAISFVRDGAREPFFERLRPLLGPGLRA